MTPVLVIKKYRFTVVGILSGKTVSNSNFEITGKLQVQEGFYFITDEQGKDFFFPIGLTLIEEL